MAQVAGVYEMMARVDRTTSRSLPVVSLCQMGIRPVPSRREIRRAVARADQLATLGELTDEALVFQDIQPVLDPEVTQEEIKRRVAEQASQILGDAETDYANYETTRALAEHMLRRNDYLSWGICGIAAGYIASAALLANPRPVDGLTTIVASILAGVLIMRRGMLRRRRERLLRELAAARGRWIDGLRDHALLPFILQTLNDLTQDSVLYATCLDPGIAPRLVERSEPRRLVASKAMDRIKAIAESMREGSLGISGPRGVGKTTVVRYFCDDAYHAAGGGTAPGDAATGAVPGAEEPELRMVLSAPVDYQPRDFILHLFTRLAEAVLDSASARHPEGRRAAVRPRWAAWLAGWLGWRGLALTSAADRQVPMEDRSRRLLADLRYLRTYSTGWSVSVAQVPAFGLGRSRGRQLAEQPVTLPELVARYREYSEDAAAWWRSSHEGQGRVLIGIDEVDKIRDAERAESFLNDIKAVFGVPGCLYLVSLSEDALAAFARRALSIRSAYDSAFDELVAVPPMTYRNSEELLIKRVAGLPRPFVALCHVLAGGLPRDLLRAARGLINAARTGKESTLPGLSGTVVRRELDSLRQASLGRLATCPGAGDLLNSLHDQQWPGTEPRHLLAAAAELSTAGRAGDDHARQLCRELIVSLSFHATVLTVFGPLHDRLVAELRGNQHGLVDELAQARHAMRLDAGLAHALIEQYLHKNGIVLRGAT